MAFRWLLLLAVACSAASADRPDSRTTIFGDEQLEGGAFEFINPSNDITLRNDVNNPYRLPTTTKPNKYTVHWIIDMTDLKFYGEVDIYLRATQANVSEIVLHAHDMDIESVDLYKGDDSTTEVFQTHTRQPEYHFLRVRLTSEYLEYDSTLETQPLYKLKIHFKADVRTDMTGMYRNWYRNNPTEEPNWMVSTHFQATAARFAFPCYDEPSFKATFDVTITRPIGYRSWFNTKRNPPKTSILQGYEDDVYTTTPVMSTYLLAVIVTNYSSKSDNEDDVQYEVIARPAAMSDHQGDYAYDLGLKLLEEMNNHTSLDFKSMSSNLKMTHAAIPDFSAGAMENYGLLVYRESYLMYNSSHTNSNFKQLISYILSHEIAHMWFGNWVTCDWWDNLWLNEGFARYYQYFLTHWVDKTLGFDQRFIPEQVHTSLLTDSADNPHPLNNPGLGSPVEVRTMFTQISYNKGAAVIRMTEHLMGFENHREGLKRYLNNRRLNTALPIHLFEALQEAAVATGALTRYRDLNIIDYYKTWSEQSGHPVLNVHVDHRSGRMTIYQRRFNINRGYSNANSNWIIPITFATAADPDFDDTKPSHIIRDSVTVIDLPDPHNDQWVIFNKQQTGFYRVNYDDYTWDLITLALRTPSSRNIIHEYNRAQIVDDVFQFARSGLMNYTRAFNILSFLKEETAYTPWVAAISGFNWIMNRVVETPLEAEINNLFIDWATPVMDELSYYPTVEDQDIEKGFMRSYFRYQLAPVMCRLRVDACLQAAYAQYQDLYDSDKAIVLEVPVDSRIWVYCNALRRGNAEDFRFLWERFLNHHVYNEKIVLLTSLGCTPDATSLNSFLDAIVRNNTIIRRQDYTTAFNSAVTGNEANTQIVFEFIKNNLDIVRDAFGSATVPLSYVSSRLRTIDEVNNFREWVEDNQQALGADYQAVYNATQTSLSALQWADRVQEDISGYISAPPAVTTSTAAPTAAPTPAPTVTAPPLVSPATPNLPAAPDAATTPLLSTLLVLLAVVINFL